MKHLEITFLSRKTSSGRFIGFVPEVPGAFSEGATEEELTNNLFDAVLTIAAYNTSSSDKLVSESFPNTGTFQKHVYALATA
jgi:predicted RNase H-like HicB family nuclease